MSHTRVEAAQEQPATKPATAAAVAVAKKTAVAKAVAKPAAASEKVVKAAPTAKPAAKAAKGGKAAKAEKAEKVEKTDKAERPKKAKLVRDSFTMPDSEYALIAALKKRCLAQGLAVKKSEVLRAAIVAFAARNDAALLAAMKRLEVIKTGRPAKA